MELEGNKIIRILKNNLVVILVLVGISARIFLFGNVPPGLNQDEASMGSDAFSLLNYGMDRNGFHYPVYLVAWGSGQSVLYAYFTMPFIYLLGLNVVSIRLVNLIFGIVSLIIFYLLVQKVTNRPVALLSLFLLAISPWHVMMSRWALDANLFPSIFLIAVFLLASSFEDKRILPASLFFFALSFYAYATSFFIVPVFLLIVFSYLMYHKKIDIKTLPTGLFIFTITALPIFLFVVINHFKISSINAVLFSIPRLTGTPRFFSLSSLFSSDFLSTSIDNFINVIKIIVTQNDGLIWNSIPEYGFIYLFSLPFLIIGFISLVRKNIALKKFEKSFLFLAWLMVSFLLGSLTNPNINRINTIFIPLIFITAMGINYITRNIKSLYLPIIILYLISFSMFSFNYFTVYPKETEQIFFESFGEAINFASEKQDSRIYVTEQVNMPYVYVLFYQKINPEIFNSSVKYYNPGQNFQLVKSFDRYEFGIKDINKLENAVYVIHNSEEGKFDQNDFVFKKFKYYSVVTRK